jgi:hypothetical protein
MYLLENDVYYRRTVVKGERDGEPTTQVLVVRAGDLLALVAITTLYNGDENPTERLLALVPNYYRNELITRAARLEAADLVGGGGHAGHHVALVRPDLHGHTVGTQTPGQPGHSCLQSRHVSHRDRTVARHSLVADAQQRPACS